MVLLSYFICLLVIVRPGSSVADDGNICTVKQQKRAEEINTHVRKLSKWGVHFRQKSPFKP